MGKNAIFPSIALLLVTGISNADLNAVIDLDNQEMIVSIDGEEAYQWPISSGRKGYETPSGNFKPTWLSKDHRSTQYDDAPMPWSVFFHEGIAVHGTYERKNLGSPVSHGCVRLDPENAKTFFELVEQHSIYKTSIEVTGSNPAHSYADGTEPAQSIKPDKHWGQMNSARDGAYFGKPVKGASWSYF